MQRLSKLVLALAAVCILLQTPSPVAAQNAVKMKPGDLRGVTGVVKTAPPDLIVSKINYSPGKPKPGDEITLWVFVQNIGRSRADGSSARIKVGGESNPPVVQVPALNPGKEWRYTRKFTMNRAGGYIVTITADARNQLAESNEQNNVKTARILVTEGPKPDLVISKINFSPGKPNTNDEIKFWVFVKNIGAGSSGPSKLQFRVGGESNPALASVPALPPGKEYRFTRQAKLGKAQNYTVTATADYNNNVKESKETNNVRKKQFSVTEPEKPKGIDVHIRSVSWNRATKKWLAIVRNDGSVSANVSIAGFPLENGVAGMTVWANNVYLGKNQERQLVGDYSSFTVPSGTRLKVHVILKPENIKLDEKIIVMN